MTKLHTIESKLHKSSINYEEHISSKILKAQERNKTCEDKYRQISDLKR